MHIFECERVCVLALRKLKLRPMYAFKVPHANKRRLAANILKALKKYHFGVHLAGQHTRLAAARQHQFQQIC